jgi:hypothetical protein
MQIWDYFKRIYFKARDKPQDRTIWKQLSASFLVGRQAAIV